jgi:acyl dehydratase
MTETIGAEAATEPVDEPDHRILEADVQRLKERIGIPTPALSESYNPVADRTSIAHYAFGNGEDNPLWHDPRYGADTRWRGQIAPPTFLVSAGVNETTRSTDPEIKRLFKGVFRGVGKYYSGVRWEWFKPVYAGDEILEEGWLADVREKTSSFGAGSRSILETNRTFYVDRAGLPFALRDESYVNIERGASRKGGKFDGIERARYTPDEIERIDRDYEAESLRGAEPRWWEDVTVGDPIGHVVKGPTTVVDVISNQMARGWGGYGPGPLRYAHKLRKRMPAFYVNDEYGVPDIVQRLHWDQSRAEAVGLPAPYDYGQMRTAWLTHVVTNWMGDDAWLWSLENQLRGFNFLGDTHWCSGEVTDKRVQDGHHVVELALRATNQKGELTAPGSAVVLLPSREHGPVVLPEAPAELRRRGAQVAAKAANVRRGITPAGPTR